MTVHLSVRLAWHDRGWDGCVCENPKSNVSCMVHEHIRDGRDDVFEEKHSKESLKNLSLDSLPPCSRDIGAFSSTEFEIVHYDPLDWRNLPSTNEPIPHYSFCTSPYGRMFSEDPEKTWEDRPEEQEKRLDEFWNELKVKENKSLVFFYVNHGNPLEEEKSDRILIGIGRILNIGPQLYFGKKEGWEDDYPLWSRCLTHNFPEEGVRLPYQEYIKAGLDPSNIVCIIPSASRSFFSYVAEHISDDVATGIIERAIQSVKMIIHENKVHEPYGKTWKYRLEWLNRALGEVWKNRGRFPGIGSVLEYLGFDDGVTYHRTVLSPIEAKGKNIFNFVFHTLENPPKDKESGFKKAANKWNSLPDDRMRLLKILSQFELTTAQVERVSNPTKREEAGIEESEDKIAENPYVLCELDHGGLEKTGEYSPSIDFETIDRGMIPFEEVGKIGGEIEPISLDDDRRIRALLVDILNDSSQEGDACLPLDEALKNIDKRLPETRRCSPDRELILNNREFYEKRLSFFPDENPKVVALKKISTMEKEVRERLEKMLKKEYEPCEKNFWEKLVKEELKGVKVLDKETEERARAEKSMVLKNMWSFRFSILTGYAGTGKTTALKIFIKGLEEKEGKQPILLLAPTGKARVRLQEITEQEAQTIHQFLMNQDWIQKETFSLKERGGRRRGVPTIIVDEASMIPLDLLATLFRAIDFNVVKRLILVGDPNQLPPIGCGRPFIDIIKWLESIEETERHIAKLTQRVRHEELESQALKLADAFLSDRTSPGDDEILSNVARGKVSGDLEVHFWNDETELNEQIDKSMEKNLKLDTSIDTDFEGFNKSIKKPDNWQILSPTRLHVFGTTEINRNIQKKYRQGLIERAKRSKPRPFGEQQMVFGDKIIQVVNSWRKCHSGGIQYDGYVANGEVGLITGAYKKAYWRWGGKVVKQPESITIGFSTQPDMTYRYYRPEVDRNLELAYAITVHKSQGSDFDKVFLILPQKARTISRELLYTGLTRFKKKVILFIEKDIAPLIIFRNPQYSEVFRRNTNLFELAVRPETVGLPHPERLIHKTVMGVLVRSKSEVVVANILTDLGISYEYEKPLCSKKDPKDFRLPDFTINYEGEVFYWEHLGMLEDPEYKKEWECKEKWYKENNYNDKLIISKDKPDGGIDSKEIEKIAKDRILENNSTR